VQTIGTGEGGVGHPDPQMTPPATVVVEPEFPILPNDGHRYMVLQWPLPATGVTSLFGKRVDPVTGTSRFHYGVDMEGHYGQTVQAAASGTVVTARWRNGHGRIVVVKHLGGWRTSYSHLSRINVTEGQMLSSGQAIGMLGNSGRSTGPHLHFEITRFGAYHDPLDLLGSPIALD